MRVFVTGATGFIGSAIVQELLGAGHQVLGLARSEEGARALSALGAEVHRGTLEDTESLVSGIAAADGVIHTAFIHDFSQFKQSCETDRRVILAMGEALAGTGKPLIITSGVALLNPGRLATEEDKPNADANSIPRVATEEAAAVVAERGVPVSVVRLSPSVHGQGDRGFVPMLIELARQKGVAAYVGEGLNRWPAVHRLDTAALYRLALEKGAPDATYHGVAEEGIPFRELAEVIGKQLNLPVVSKSVEEAKDHFGWFFHFASIDCPTRSQQTQQRLGWQPGQPGLLTELHSAAYF